MFERFKSKNICDNCKQEFVIHKINGVCGDVHYALSCGCMRIGFNPYEGDEYGYYGIMALVEEYRVPTFSDKFKNKSKSFFSFVKTFFKNLLDFRGPF